MKKLILAVCLLLSACGSPSTVKSAETSTMKAVTAALPSETGLLITFTATNLKAVELAVTGVVPKNLDSRTDEVFLNGDCSLAFGKLKEGTIIHIVALDMDVLDKRYIFIPYVSANNVKVEVVNSTNDNYEAIPVDVRFVLQEEKL